jgi:hypothetical protein
MLYALGLIVGLPIGLWAIVNLPLWVLLYLAAEARIYHPQPLKGN